MSRGRKALVTAVNVAILKDRRARRAQTQYAARVLDEFDRMERADQRQREELRADVERNAREAL